MSSSTHLLHSLSIFCLSTSISSMRLHLSNKILHANNLSHLNYIWIHINVILNFEFFVMKMIVIFLFAISNNFIVPNGCKTNNGERKVSIVNERWLLITSLTNEFFWFCLKFCERCHSFQFTPMTNECQITKECKNFHVHNNRCGYIIIFKIITSWIHIINKNKYYFWKLINVLNKIY